MKTQIESFIGSKYNSNSYLWSIVKLGQVHENIIDVEQFIPKHESKYLKHSLYNQNKQSI